MIPTVVESHLRQHHPRFELHHHSIAQTAQELAAVEHASGRRVAKPVVVKLDDEFAIAVVAATDRVSLSAIEEATGAKVELASELELAERFAPCEIGAEPPLAMFGVPILVDDRLLHEQTLVMPAGTHEDAIVLDTHEWAACERVQPIANLGLHPSPLV